MQQYSSTEDISTRIEELILSCKPFIERMAHKHVRLGNSLLEFDDYVSVGMARIWKDAEAVLSADVPSVYACRIADIAMIGEYRRFHQHADVSLDAPLTSDSSFSLADLLPDRPKVSWSRASVKRVRAVRSALNRLSARQRDSLSFRYGLVGYGYAPESEAAASQGTSVFAVRMGSYWGRSKLRSDALFCKAVGVEVTYV